MELNYVKVGDYLLPNLTIERQNNEKINKYGNLRLNYLKENNKPLYTTLLMKNELKRIFISSINKLYTDYNLESSLFIKIIQGATLYKKVLTWLIYYFFYKYIPLKKLVKHRISNKREGRVCHSTLLIFI